MGKCAMASEHEQLSETHIVGDDTQQWIVRADDCTALEQRHISHVGFGDAAVPYRIVRTRLSGAYIHGSLGGEGRMLLDGRWCTMRGGMMSFAPAHGLHAFHAVPEKRWQYCWLRYLPSAPRSVVGTIAPIMQHFDPEPMKHAILGLYSEVFHGEGDPASCVMWVDTIERYISRFADPWRRDARIVAVFDAVIPTLERHWTIEEMAEIAHVSTEHLRRISRKVFGRSPMQQLTQLRMQHATHLLATSDLPIEEIAERVGYSSPFAFSKTFKRMNGVSPSHFRLHSRA
ncbi:AraC family transcriptional regulator [Billgrantia tianxiuensis]|uniref:AraC family transcriptional regulator n=2 Tax=Oceanospirillales TaxID=135619 RepID=A0A6I6SIU2_9GAMM|nr:AraC family transcriptional regulator [Halomonas sp. MCCC 1A11057]QHC48334.1 AraC family transcriptional regulator [Halomonas tianxiuensis]